MPLKFLGRRDGQEQRREAILSGPLRSTTFWLALPVLGEQTLNLFVAFFDTWLAGHLPGASDGLAVETTGSVGFAAYVSWLAVMVASFVGTGTSALVSRLWGAGQRGAASVVTNRSLVLALLAGVAFALVILLGAERLVELLGTRASLADASADYLRKEAAAYPPLMVSLIIAAAMRGSGDLISPLRILVVANAVNAFCSVALAYGWGPLPQMGADGIVVGTVVARWVQCGLLLQRLASGRSGLRLIVRHWRIGGRTTFRILRIGVPAALDGLVFWTAHVIFLRIVNEITLPSQDQGVAFAAHIVGIRVESLTYLTATAWSVAAGTMIGQNLGADQPRRARRAGTEAAVQAGLLAAAITVFFVVFTEPIFRFMTEDDAIRRAGLDAFRLVGFFQIPLACGIVFVGGLRGAGQTRLPMVITAASSYLVRLPLAYAAAIWWGYGLWGAWLGMSVDMFVRGTAAWVMYRLLRWEKTVV